ncbi:hypothetical protein GCM10009765_21130 [Fodinicola feengrottensis]|uniref:WD40 repeat domain-containing protein n=1 Tax=Fodinicola feengrottensis TaxID=435914 RepID=A0ABP4SE36_9ACTN
MSQDLRTVVTTDDNLVAVYDASTGALRHSFETEFPEDINKVLIHPDGRRLLTGRGYDGAVVRIHDLESGTELDHFGINDDTLGFFLLPDSRRVLTGYCQLDMWDLDNGLLGPLWTQDDCASCLEPMLHPNGEWIINRDDDRIAYFSVADGSLVRELKVAHDDPGMLEEVDHGALLLPDARRAVFAVGNGVPVLEVFDIETGERFSPLEGHAGQVQALALSPDGDRFASVADDGFVRVWDSISLECVWTAKAHEGKAADVTFCGNEAVITVGADGDGRLWDVV